MPNFCPDCGVKWSPDHECNPRYYVLTAADVGRSMFHARGKTWPLSDVIGRVQPIDVGKRVYWVQDPARGVDILQVESNDQRDARETGG